MNEKHLLFLVLMIPVFYSCREEKTVHISDPLARSATSHLYQECIRFSFNPRFTCVEADSSSVQLFMLTAQDDIYRSYRGDVYGELLYGNVKLCLDDIVITCDSARWIPADSILAINGSMTLETPEMTLHGLNLKMHVGDDLAYTIDHLTAAYRFNE